MFTESIVTIKLVIMLVTEQPKVFAAGTLACAANGEGIFPQHSILTPLDLKYHCWRQEASGRTARTSLTGQEYEVTTHTESPPDDAVQN
jgi:hypothetical protein